MIKHNEGVYCHNLSVSYQGHVALKNVTGCFKKGSLTAIIGPNGSGKTTLFKVLSGQIRPNIGKIEFHAVASHPVGYLAQTKDIDPFFPLSVFDIAAQGLITRLKEHEPLSAAHQDEILATLEHLNLMPHLNSTLSQLSGGQRQRVFFARLSLQKASFILLDEPFAAVDPYTLDELIEYIYSWQAGGATILMISHDLDVVRHHFPESLLLVQEPVAWGRTEDVLSIENLRHAKSLSRLLKT